MEDHQAQVPVHMDYCTYDWDASYPRALEQGDQVGDHHTVACPGEVRGGLVDEKLALVLVPCEVMEKDA